MFFSHRPISIVSPSPQEEEEIEGELDRRVKYFMSVFGSGGEMEAYCGKSVAEMKEDFTDDIKNQLTFSDKMKGKVFTGLKVSPQEVTEFFAKPQGQYPLLQLRAGDRPVIVMFPQSDRGRKGHSAQESSKRSKRT
jgi:peptidyl-prolyl cis-trans isomerase SurA